MKNNLSELIVEKFTKKFISAYKKLSGPGKTKVLKYSPVIFKRWYYSALVNETTLSPSFIYNSGVNSGSSICSPSISPIISGSSLKGFSIKENSFNIHKHPVVRDLQVFLEYCTPDVDLDERNYLTEATSNKIISFMSISDPFYIDYLTSVAFHLRLLKKSDAIYSNKAAISNNYMSFFELYQEEAIKKIVDATIAISSKNISDVLPQKVSFVSEKGIIQLIKKPMPIDEIFKRIFGALGVDIEKLWDEYETLGTTADDDENAILSSTFFLGIVLDRWFITPFSEYLKIIEPIYCFCYNFEDELNYLFDVIKGNGNISTALFSPCAFYSFTPFGRILLSNDSSLPPNRKAATIPVTELMELFDFDQEPASKKEINTGIETKEVYSFKVKLCSDKRYWKQIDAADYNTLHDLHLEISASFDFTDGDYSFYLNENLDPFYKYVSPKSKRTQHRSDAVAIAKLSIIKGNKIVYFSGSGEKIEIELMRINPVNKKSHFPQTVRQSKLMQEKNR